MKAPRLHSIAERTNQGGLLDSVTSAKPLLVLHCILRLAASL